MNITETALLTFRRPCNVDDMRRSAAAVAVMLPNRATWRLVRAKHPPHPFGTNARRARPSKNPEVPARSHKTRRGQVREAHFAVSGTLTSTAATICHLPLRQIQVSVHTYRPCSPFCFPQDSLPRATAASPYMRTCTSLPLAKT